MPESESKLTDQEMKEIAVVKKTTPIIFIGLAIFCLLLGAGGAIAWQNYFPSQKQIPSPPALPQPSGIVAPSLPIPQIPADWKTYTNPIYGYTISYPQNWQMSKPGPDEDPSKISFTNIVEGHTIIVNVWRVTGFGYCYKYGDRQEVTVDGKKAETADGVGGTTEICEEDMTNRGNTSILIPIDDDDDMRPANKIHISYDYPLNDLSLAKANLNQILSTFKFLEEDSKGDVKKLIKTDKEINEFKNDSYTINDIQILNNILQVDVSYGGGCKEHDFDLYWRGSIATSLPPQVDLYLIHNANEDICKAWISKELEFDISELEKINTNEVVINFYDFKTQKRYPKKVSFFKN